MVAQVELVHKLYPVENAKTLVRRVLRPGKVGRWSDLVSGAWSHVMQQARIKGERVALGWRGTGLRDKVRGAP